jgi:hypothetical protein
VLWCFIISSYSHGVGLHVKTINGHLVHYMFWQHIQNSPIICEHLDDNTIFTYHRDIQWLIMPLSLRIKFIFGEI